MLERPLLDITKAFVAYVSFFCVAQLFDMINFGVGSTYDII